MEALLKLNFPEFVNIQAYADDIAISIAADTRNSLKERAADVLLPVIDWGRNRGLTFSAQKSVAMITKGGLQPGFPIPFGTDKIITKPTVKYLGILLDQNRNFKAHIDQISITSSDIFSKLRGTLGQGWGIKLENILAIYRCVYLPKITYGMRFWSHVTTNSQNSNI